MTVRSLRTQLLSWVLLPLSATVMLLALLDHVSANHTASMVQDRLLLGSARVIAEDILFEDGAFQQQLPPAAIELFQSGGVDKIYYRATTAGGEMLMGYTDLAQVAGSPSSPMFSEARVRGDTVRMVTLVQPVVTPQGMVPVTVQVAQTLHGHDQLLRSLWLGSLVPQILILALASGLILLGLQRGLRPVMRLRDVVLARAPDALSPIDSHAIPTELAPLVDALNSTIARHDEQVGAQRVFIDNAAHQLRTPLTLLSTQISVAQRSQDSAQRQLSLRALKRTVNQAVRLVHQLLTLSSAESPARGADRREPLDLVNLARQALEDMAGQAQARQIDLGWDCALDVAWVSGQAVMAREIVLNLIDNAIRYTQPGGVVTVGLALQGGMLALRVEDNGPGISPELREQAVTRFVRLSNVDSDGSGLGLAIVQQFAQRLGGTLSLQTASCPPGLCAVILLPLAQGAAHAQATGGQRQSGHA
jgi:two-component system, OmpR family, sensor histidine kinase TctE